jgi:hypothetical protein
LQKESENEVISEGGPAFWQGKGSFKKSPPTEAGSFFAPNLNRQNKK